MNTKQEERLIERARTNPETIENFSVKELQVIAYEAMGDVYGDLMDLLEGNEPAKELLRKHNALEFFAYEPKKSDVGDIQNVRKIITNLWTKEPQPTEGQKFLEEFTKELQDLSDERMPDVLAVIRYFNWLDSGGTKTEEITRGESLHAWTMAHYSCVE